MNERLALPALAALSCVALSVSCKGSSPPVMAAEAKGVHTSKDASVARAEASCVPSSSYVPRPAWSGAAMSLPAVPNVPPVPPAGGTYTVNAAVHQLRSELHSREVTTHPITVVGYIVDSNLPRAPACAIHAATKPNATDCNSPVPTFWIADERMPSDGAPRILVLGWAQSFAAVFDAMVATKRRAAGPVGAAQSSIVGALPDPLPSVGAKVEVVGSYDTDATFGTVSMHEGSGALVVTRVQTVEAAAAPAAFARPIP